MHLFKTERTITDHISRYTIAIDRFLPVDDRERALLTIDRLLRSRHISQWQHSSGLRYWTLRSARPLSDTPLIRSLGILLFCHQTRGRSLITKSDIEVYFPNLFRHGLPGGHYINRSDEPVRLGHIRVDSCNSTVKRLTVRSARLIHKYRQQSGFRELMDDGRFELTWIVPTQPKQRRLTAALRPLLASGMQTRVCAVPELLSIIAPIPHR